VVPRGAAWCRVVPRGAAWCIDMMLPSETGPDYALGDCLAPLAAHRENFVLVSNLRKSEAWIGQDIDNDAHARGHASWCTGHGLTAAGVGGPSVDQVAAEALWQQQTRLRSWVVALGPNTYFRGHVAWSAPDGMAGDMRQVAARGARPNLDGSPK